MGPAQGSSSELGLFPSLLQQNDSRRWLRVFFAFLQGKWSLKTKVIFYCAKGMIWWSLISGLGLSTLLPLTSMAPNGLSFNYQTLKEEPRVFPRLWWGQVVKQREGLPTQSTSGISVIKKMLTSSHWAGRKGGDEWNHGRKEHGAFPDATPGTCRFCDTFDQVKVMLSIRRSFSKMGEILESLAIRDAGCPPSWQRMEMRSRAACRWWTLPCYNGKQTNHKPTKIWKRCFCVLMRELLCICGRALGLMCCSGRAAGEESRIPKGLGSCGEWSWRWDACPFHLPHPALQLQNRFSFSPPHRLPFPAGVPAPGTWLLCRSGTDLRDANCPTSISTLHLPLCSSCLNSKSGPAQSLLQCQKGLSGWISTPLALPFSSLKHRCSLMSVFFSTTCLRFLFALVNTEPHHYFCV